MPAPRKFAIGDRVWKFDESRRIYGKSGGGPIYSEHFVEHEILGIEGHSYRIAQVTPPTLPIPTRYGFQKAERTFMTVEEKEDRIYREENRYELAERVSKADAVTLRLVAFILDSVGDPS